jgi:DtxR family Mn-dependent transcriptional regulator
MQILSSTEENYLKAIFKLSESPEEAVSTNAISAQMETSAASVTDMLKRLSEKELLHYIKYRGVRLSSSGLKVATSLVRKHRLWETFLVEKLDFSWDEIHPIAEQMEHIQSEELVDRLDSFLGFPKFDPHGDPIPDKEGNITYNHQMLISEMQIGSIGVVVGVKDHSTSFLRYLEKLKLLLGAEVLLLEKNDYDQSIHLKINGVDQIITQKVCNNLYIKPEK